MAAPKSCLIAVDNTNPRRQKYAVEISIQLLDTAVIKVPVNSLLALNILNTAIES